MAKSIDERVADDIKKATADRRKKKLEEDYQRWIHCAAQAQKAEDKVHYTKLAKSTLAQLDKLRNSK